MSSKPQYNKRRNGNFCAVVGVFPPTTLAEAPYGIIYKYYKTTHLHNKKGR